VNACAAGSSPENRARAISMMLAQVSGWYAIAVCPKHHRRRLYKGRGGRETKGRRAGTACSLHAGNGIRGVPKRWREAAVAGCAGANSVAAIDSGLICVRPLGALQTQTDSEQKTTDFLSTAQRKWTKTNAICVEPLQMPQ
jgi:hypothetical protein